MSKSLLLMLCLLTGILVLACAKSDTNRNAAAPAGTNSAAPAASPAATPHTSASAGDKIGIAECDSFLTSYENCVTTKVPEAGRAAYKKAIADWRASWKKLADNPQTKGTLAGVCKTQLETARTQLKSYGCTF
jgi:hypothetical protein